MIVATDKLDVSVHGVQKTEEFTMQASAKAFSLIMDELYSNKIGSVIRELGSNCRDAMVLKAIENNTPEEPFHIKMPNSLDPTVKFRDYGHGLSDNDMYNLYTTFFASTKEQSNDFIGAFGIGSKAFFSVTDSANITSYFNGVKTVYVAYLNSSRIPCLSTFSSMPTDEPNGLEIEVAIKKDETKYFRDEVNNQLKYFKVKPTISGDSQFEWDLEEEYVYKGANGDWKMVGAGRYDTIRAVQGQVSYPISVHNMGVKAKELDPALTALLQTNLLLTFDIGEININPSRESLSYDTATINNIMKKAKTVLKELPQQIANKLQSVETEWEARLAYQDICKSLGGNGTTLLRKIEDTGLIKWKDVDIFSVELEIPGDLFIAYKSFNKNGFRKWKKDNKRLITSYSTDDKDPYWDFRVQKDKLIVYATTEDKAVDARTKQYCMDNNRFTVHILTSAGPDDKFDDIRAALGHPEMIRASDLEKVRREKKTGTTDKTIRVQYFTDGWSKTERWSSYEIVDDLNELNGLYVNLDRVKVMHDDIELKEFNNFMNMIKKLNILDGLTVYGLRAQNQKRTHNLEYLPDFIRRKIKETGLKVNMFYSQVFSNQINDDGCFRRDILKTIPKSSDFYKITKAIDENVSKQLSVQDIKRLKSVGIEVSGKNMKALTERVHSKYPMVSGSRYRCSDKEIMNYCMQMDELEKLKG